MSDETEVRFATEPATIRILQPGLYKVVGTDRHENMTIHIPESGLYELVWGPRGFVSLTRVGPYGDEPSEAT